jgi:hypothetical protein
VSDEHDGCRLELENTKTELASLRAQLEQVTKERDEALEDAKDYENLAQLNGEVADALKVKLAASEAGAAALREALTKTLPFVKHGNCDCEGCRASSAGWKAEELAKAALSSDAGRGWVRAEVVEQALDQAQRLRREDFATNDAHLAHEFIVEKLRAALAPPKAK